MDIQTEGQCETVYTLQTQFVGWGGGGIIIFLYNTSSFLCAEYIYTRTFFAKVPLGNREEQIFKFVYVLKIRLSLNFNQLYISMKIW